MSHDAARNLPAIFCRLVDVRPGPHEGAHALKVVIPTGVGTSTGEGAVVRLAGLADVQDFRGQG